MRKSIPSQCRGAGQTLCGGDEERVEAGGACVVEAGAGVREEESGRGDMLLDKREPIDLFSARVCVSIGPPRLLGGLTDRRRDGTDPQMWS